jgi:hypothetical protein
MTETVDQAQAQPPRALAGVIEDATSLCFVPASHFEGSRVAASPHGDPVLRQAVTSVPVIPYTTSVGVNLRGARLDDTSSAASAKLTVRRGGSPGRCAAGAQDGTPAAASAGQIASQGTGACSWRVKMGSMLDHLSIQCADVTAGATFYDAALPPGSADAA